jgi:hypothetical protein
MIESHIKSLATIEIEELDMFDIHKAELPEPPEQFGSENYLSPLLFEDSSSSPSLPIETDSDTHTDTLLFE